MEYRKFEIVLVIKWHPLTLQSKCKESELRLCSSPIHPVPPPALFCSSLGASHPVPFHYHPLQ